MLYVLTVAMHKGGVGKTTTAAVLAQAGAYSGKRVLAVDLDPQCNLTFALGADPRQPGSYELLEGTKPAIELFQPCKGIDVIPASRMLAAEKSTKGSATRLRQALQPIANYYDFIIFDTPTIAGELLYNALYASNGLVIPTEADIYNLQSIYQLTDTAQQMQKANKHLQVLGFIITKADNRTILAKQMQEKLIATGVPYLGQVRNGIVVKEAAALQTSLYEYAPKSKPAEDYLQIFNKIYPAETKGKRGQKNG